MTESCNDDILLNFIHSENMANGTSGDEEHLLKELHTSQMVKRMRMEHELSPSRFKHQNFLHLFSAILNDEDVFDSNVCKF